MTLPKLKYPNMEPPGGWIYRDLDTGMWITSKRNLADLISQCIAHRTANDLAIPENFPAKIEASLAYSVSPELAVGLPADRKLSDQMMSLYQVNKSTNQYLLDWRLNNGMLKVEQDEAEDRAETCASCKHNRREICLTCKGIDQWVRGWTKRKTKFDPVLGVCDCDGIVLYATIHADVQTNGDYPDFCWKSKAYKEAMAAAGIAAS